MFKALITHEDGSATGEIALFFGLAILGATGFVYAGLAQLKTMFM